MRLQFARLAIQSHARNLSLSEYPAILPWNDVYVIAYDDRFNCHSPLVVGVYEP